MMDSKKSCLCIFAIAMVVFAVLYPGVLAKEAKAKASREAETAAQKFIGTWQLVTSEFRSEDGKVAYPLGEKAAGILMCDSGRKKRLIFFGSLPDPYEHLRG